MSATAKPLPGRRTTTQGLLAILAGLVAFGATLAAGVLVTYWVVRAIPPEVPHPTEAYEGFGDAMTAASRFFLGAGASFVFAAVIGFVVAAWVDYPKATKDRV